jgi:hypothetical protein
MIHERAIEFFEIVQLAMEPAADNRRRHVVSAASNAGLNARDCQSNGMQPQEEQLDTVTRRLPLWNMARVAPPAERGFHRKSF